MPIYIPKSRIVAIAVPESFPVGSDVVIEITSGPSTLRKENPFAREEETFQNRFAELQSSHPDQYVAIQGEDVIDSDQVLDVLGRRVFQKIGTGHVYFAKVMGPHEEVHFSGQMKVLDHPIA